MSAKPCTVSHPVEQADDPDFSAEARAFLATPLPPHTMAHKAIEQLGEVYGAESMLYSYALDSYARALSLPAHQMRESLTHGARADFRERVLVGQELARALWFRLRLVYCLDRFAASKLFGPLKSAFADGTQRGNARTLLRLHRELTDYKTGEKAVLDHDRLDALRLIYIPRLHRVFVQSTWQPVWRALQRTMEGMCRD